MTLAAALAVLALAQDTVPWETSMDAALKSADATGRLRAFADAFRIRKES